MVISLIHGYAHQDLEAQIANAVAERFPGVTAYSAAKLVPFSREYERVETALANAVGPTMHRYFQRLRHSRHRPMGHYGVSGGLMTLEEAMEEPIRTAISAQLVVSRPRSGFFRTLMRGLH